MASASATIPVGYKQTEVGVIPEDWMVKPIGKVAKVVGGGTPSTQVQKYWNGDIYWFTPTEVGSRKYVSDSNRKLTNLGLQNSSASLLPKGTILLTSRAGIGDLGVLEFPACTNQGFQSLVTFDNVDNEFLYYVMLTKRPELERRGSGSTFLEISPSEVKSLLIALPGLKEQYTISEVLSDNDSQIQNLEKLISKKRDIKQGTMQELLTGKTRLPGFSGEWNVEYLGEMCGFYSGGTPSTSNTSYYGGNIAWITSSDLNRERIEHVNGRITNEGLSNSSAKMVERNSLLYAMYGATAGVAAITKIEAAINQAVLCIKPHSIDYIFLYYVLRLNKLHFIDKYTQGGQPNFSSSIVKFFEIKYPNNKDEQEAIAEVLSDMDAEIAALEQRLEKTKAIKQGMMQQLLTGRIRLVDPSTPVEASA